MRDPGTLLSFRLIGSLLLTTASLALAARESRAADAPGSAPASAVEKTNDWKALFDGKTLKGWKVTDFAGHGEVAVDTNFHGGPAIVADMGAILTGITWTNEPPKGEYELTLEAMKADGSDFFCALTFPVGAAHCSLVIGGWGGGVVGISSIDSMDASENETTKFLSFDKNKWYRIRLRVTRTKLEAWIDKDKVVDIVTTDRRISMRAGEIELAEPFGISNYQTKSAWRDIRIRNL
jgi:hypothetical protein